MQTIISYVVKELEALWAYIKSWKKQLGVEWYVSLIMNSRLYYILGAT